MKKSDRSKSRNLERGFKANTEQNIYELEKKVYELSTLLDIAKVLSSTLNLEQVLDIVTFTCMGQLACASTFIFLAKDIDDPTLSLSHYMGYDDENIEMDLIEDNKMIEYFLKNGRAHLLNEFKSKKGFEHINQQIEILEPNIISPLMTKNKVNGILILGEKMTGMEYTEVELDFISDISNLAGLAVENARLYEMATLDRMTKLNIHHYFQARLSEEIAKSIKFNTELSLILLDLDHFKTVNDVHGHQQGDTVLIHVGKIIKDNIKSDFFPARYGGEEFIIILPETSREEARKFAEKLRKEIQHYKFPAKSDPIKITASFGVAAFDYNNPIQKEDFIEHVDKAMYHAKNSGRNKVSVY